MPRVYNLKDIYLGAPSFSGHEVYLDAVYYPSDPSEKILELFIRKISLVTLTYLAWKWLLVS